MTSESNLARLATLGSEALNRQEPRLASDLKALAGPRGGELEELLRLKNGFMAFESALHVFPSGGKAKVTLELWNSAAVWRSAYGNLADGCLFFAQDAVASQFCIYQGAICRFDPETGDKEQIAQGLDEWAGLVLRDYSRVTAYPLAHEWQLHNRALSEGERLFAKYPFVLGGDYTPTNLRCTDAIAGMRFMGELASKIHNLPEGARVEIRVVD